MYFVAALRRLKESYPANHLPQMSDARVTVGTPVGVASMPLQSLVCSLLEAAVLTTAQFFDSPLVECANDVTRIDCLRYHEFLRSALAVASVLLQIYVFRQTD